MIMIYIFDTCNLCIQKVCECLLRKGTLPLVQIIQFTELSKQNAVNSLLVLIQHNCVQAFATQTEGTLNIAFVSIHFRPRMCIVVFCIFYDCLILV